MRGIIFCKACLSLGDNMIRIRDNNTAENLYKNVFGLEVNRQDHLCFECAHQMNKFQKFYSRCHTAADIMEKLPRSKARDEDHIKLMQKQNGLESKFKMSPVDIFNTCSTYGCNVKDKFVSLNVHTQEINIENDENVEHSDDMIQNVQESDNDCKEENMSETECAKDDSNNTSGFLFLNVEQQKQQNVETDANNEVPKEFLDHVDTVEDNCTPVNQENNILCDDITEIKDNSNCHDGLFKYTLEIDPEYLKEGNLSLINVRKRKIDETESTEKTFDQDMSENSYESTDSTIKAKKSVCVKRKSDRSKKQKDKGIFDRLPKREKLKYYGNMYKEYGKIVHLSPDDARAELELKKESKNYKLAPYRCPFCYKGFDLENTYNNHMKRHDPDTGEYDCSFCHMKFTKSRLLRHHLYQAHEVKFSCNRCDFVCYSMYQVKLHVELHKGKTYDCETCNLKFSMPHSLRMHNRKKHRIVSEYVCGLCGDTFATKNGCRIHNMKMHIKETNEKNGPECKECNIQFSNERAWKRHLVLSTKHEVSNGCACCGETFPDAISLKRHNKVHARPVKLDPETQSKLTKFGNNKPDGMKMPCKCKFCGTWLLTKTLFQEHMVSKHPESEYAEYFRLTGTVSRDYVCEICGKGLSSIIRLSNHQRLHTGEKPFKCEICGKAFALQTTMCSHRLRHYDRPKNIKCDLCGNLYMSQGSLIKHMKNHLDIRPHKCVICNRGFTDPSALKTHIKYIHDKVPWPKKNGKRKNITTLK